MEQFNPKDWHFLNMNSPADLSAQYGIKPDAVTLSEYDGCRDGHALLSGFRMEDTMYFAVAVREIGEGIAAGLYYGDGCYSDYLLITAQKDMVSVRVPNGTPVGDTFRRKGCLRYYTLAQAFFDTGLLTELAFRKTGQNLSVYVNGNEILKEISCKIPFHGADRNPRIMVKALNETEILRRADTVLSGYFAEGIVSDRPLLVKCVEKDTQIPWKNGSVHVIGEWEQWYRTDGAGEVCIGGLPNGVYQLVLGRAEEEFVTHTVRHDGSMRIIEVEQCMAAGEAARENIPQERLESDAAFIGLNGLWDFELDRMRTGEEEKWYLKEQKSLTRCIRVPFSWQSLLASGEEELADEYTLHQANPWLCTPEEVGERGWYRRNIRTEWGGNTELVFAAVSGIGKVWLDGKLLGCVVDSYNQHVFSLGKLEAGRDYCLTVMVDYEHGNSCRCSGKQGFWFTDAPGIWQNVWLRERFAHRITEILVNYEIGRDQKLYLEAEAELDLTIESIPLMRNGNVISLTGAADGCYCLEVTYRTPYESLVTVLEEDRVLVQGFCLDAVSGEGIFDTARIYLPLNKGTHQITLQTGEPELQLLDIKAQRLDMGRPVLFQWNGQAEVSAFPEWNREDARITAKFRIVLDEWAAWSPEHPVLYSLSASISGEKRHTVRRSVGFRSIGTSERTQTHGSYLTINGRETYVRGVLDQGYNPWGIYTYPALRGEKAGSAEFDVRAAIQCGYNLMRMHIKDNEPDWYRICDEYGMLVWDELPCNFYGTAHDRHWQSMYKRQLRAAVRKHNYHPSIILCSTVNESWGISGDHEKSPWDDEEAQELIAEYAGYYKSHHPAALVIDNSGYGKTSGTQVLDYHSYPRDFEDAHAFFKGLEQMNYPGSVFNCYHEDNRGLMQRDEIRELLQRTSAQDLKNMNYSGKECQSGQPVLLSEFVHTDRQEELIRIFPGFAGYVRMNLASAENEDTSPFTAKRTRRDFGFLDSDMSSVGYQTVNGEDFLFMDLPYLSKVGEGDEIAVPVWASLWSGLCENGEELEVRFRWNLVSTDGVQCDIPLQETLKAVIGKNEPYLIGNPKISVPEGYLGGWLFAELYRKEMPARIRLAVSSVQFEIFPQKREEILPEKQGSRGYWEWDAVRDASCFGFDYTGTVEEKERSLKWCCGQGILRYEMQLPAEYNGTGTLVLEASGCDGMEGTKLTDANGNKTKIRISLNKRSLGIATIKPLSQDMRGLFSNSSAGEEAVVDYCRTGRFGYGSRVELSIPQDVLIQPEGKMVLEIEAEDGIVIYGRRMGRFGCNPMIRTQGKKTEDTL